MFGRPRLQLLESYEVIGQPIVSARRLTYVPWVEQACRPYTATCVPSGRATGLEHLADALRALVVPGVPLV
jgi:hypothetical protein